MILFLTAYILILPLTIINFFVVRSRGYFKSTAINMDMFGNREFRATWNKFLITKDGYRFGDPKETISSALGKNQLKGTLTITGKILCWILDAIDPNHCIKSIKEL